MVPSRSTPRVASKLENRTVTVQLSPGASVVPVHVSGPANAPEISDQVNSPDPGADTLWLVTVKLAPPIAGDVLVSVTVPVPVTTAGGRTIVSGLGVIETVARFATPAPVSVTGEPFTMTPTVV